MVSVPSTSEGLAEVLADQNKAAKFFNQQAAADGTMREFVTAIGVDFIKNNPDTIDALKTQVQSAVMDLARENGAGSRTALNLGNSVSFQGGRPTLRLSQDGTAAVARGRGAVYNKETPGARMEDSIPEADRFHSIGEYCQAIRFKHTAIQGRNRAELIRKLDLVESFQNSFGSEDPGAGGFLIPEIMRSELFMLALESSLVRSHATVIPMSTLTVPIPTVDDTSHVTSVMGGVQFYWAEESASLTESQAVFGRVNLVAKKLAGYFKVPNELLADAPAFSAFFDQQVPKALAWFEDNSFMNSTGTGEPLGFASAGNAANVVVSAETGQDAGTVVWPNIVKMYQSLLPTSRGNAVWIVSHDVFAQLATMALSVGTGGGPVWIGNFSGGRGGADTPPMTLLGLPVYYTEKVGPLGTQGDINLVDLSYYLIGDRQAVEVAASEHVAFQNDQTAFRLIERVDGRPWLQSPLTPHNNSSVKLSAFVQLASR